MSFLETPSEQANWRNRYCALFKYVLLLYGIDNFTLAREINTSEATVRQWHTGRNYPSKAYLDGLYEYLKKQIDKHSNPILAAQLMSYISTEISSYRINSGSGYRY
jgi:transcriptional regulator with XRE-family HTH domain